MKAWANLVAGALAGALVGLGSPAHAERAPSFAEVPEASVPDVPRIVNAPERLAASESVAGISVVAELRGPKRPPAASITASDRRCFRGALATAPSLVAREPALLVTGMVTSMRSERLVVEQGRAQLEIVDAWVDPSTLGAREVARTVVPLAKLGEAPGGFAVYAFRHGDTLEVVTPARASLHFQDPDVPFGAPLCGHVRSTLEAKPGSGAAMNATVFVEVGSAPAPLAEPVQTDEPLVLARFLDVSVGVSRSSSDPAPVLGVTFAWGDDEPRPVVKSQLATGAGLGVPMPPMMPPEEAHPVRQIRSTGGVRQEPKRMRGRE